MFWSTNINHKQLLKVMGHLGVGQKDLCPEALGCRNHHQDITKQTRIWNYLLGGTFRHYVMSVCVLLQLLQLRIGTHHPIYWQSKSNRCSTSFRMTLPPTKSHSFIFQPQQLGGDTWDNLKTEWNSLFVTSPLFGFKGLPIKRIRI